MADDLAELADRVQRLEKDNGRLKLAGVTMAAVLVVVAGLARVLRCVQDPSTSQMRRAGCGSR